MNEQCLLSHDWSDGTCRRCGVIQKAPMALSEWHAPGVGISIPHPADWLCDFKQVGGITSLIIHAPDGRMFNGETYEIGMTFTPGQRASDVPADDEFAADMATQLATASGRRLVWRGKDKMPSGQAVQLFSFAYRRSGFDLMTLAVLAARHPLIYYIDVTGLTSLIEERSEEWWSVLRKVDIRR